VGDPRWLEQAVLWLSLAALALVVIWAFARRAAREIAEDLESGSRHLDRCGRRIGLVVAALAVGAVGTTFAWGMWHERSALVAGWAIGATALVATYVAGTRLMLGAERPLHGPLWHPGGRLRAMMAVTSLVWFPLLCGAWGPLVLQVAAPLVGGPLPWIDGTWIPLALLALHLSPGLGTALGRPGPLPEEIAQAYAAVSPLQPPPATWLLRTGRSELVNAFAVWRPRRSAICVTDALTEVLTPAETAALMLHEEAHLAYRHVPLQLGIALLWQGVAVLFLQAVGGLNPASAACWFLVYVGAVRPRVTQRCERACDAYAARHGGAPEILARALEKGHRAAHVVSEWETQGWSRTHPDLASRMRTLGVEAEDERGSADTADPGRRSGSGR
jgi:Zn-dependent protease with chaperone function